MAHLVQFAVKNVASGICLVSEGIAAHKSKKKDRRTAGLTSSTDSALDGAVLNSTSHHATREQNPSSQSPSHQTEPEEAEFPDDSDDEVDKSPAPDPRDIEHLADSFIRDHPSPASNELVSVPKLALPVVIPQRRPKDRSRGFYRAYAPALAEFGIDQDMFLDFLKTFEKASQASPLIHAINVATIGTMFLPHAIAMAISVAAQIATNVAIEVHSRYRTNKFLDKINNEFFRPRGLYCLVMTWQPDSDELSRSFSLASTVSTIAEGGPPGVSKIKHNLRSSSGKTSGTFPFPETAELIFPEYEDGETKNKFKKTQAFVENYHDRRAQAKFSSKNPDHKLAQTPKPTFASRYADPSHPASSGDPLALVTGGHFSVTQLNNMRGGPTGGLGGGSHGGFGGRGGGGFGGGLGGRGGGLGGGLGALVGGVASLATRRGSFQGREGGGVPGLQVSGRTGGTEAEAQMHAQTGPYRGGRGLGGGMGGFGGGRGRGMGGFDAGRGGGLGGGLGGPNVLIGGVKKLLKKDVLYLMVVNMPTEDEMAEAHRVLDEMTETTAPELP